MPLQLPTGLKIAGIAALAVAAPVGAAISAQLIGEAFGCSVNEGGASPCFVAGVDIGEALNTLFVAGWLGVLALPLAAPAFLVGLGMAAFEVLRRRRWRRAAR